MDVVNIDLYDAVIGCPMMRQHKIAVDFEYEVIRVKGEPAPTLTAQEDEAEVLRRSTLREGEGLSRPHPLSSSRKKQE
jgi:hypothetical protein